MATTKKTTKAAVKKAAPAKAKSTKSVAKKPVKKAAAKTPVKKVAKKPSKAQVKAAPKAIKPVAAHGGLHYDKEAVINECDDTYNMFMKAVGFIIGGVLVYFFIFIVYLGGFSHTKHTPFVKHFGDRIDDSVEYDGLKLPIYGEEK